MHLILLKIQNMMDIKYDGLASVVYKIFHKKTSGSGIKAEDLHKPIIINFN